MTVWATARVEAAPSARDQTRYFLRAMGEDRTPRAGRHEGVIDSAAITGSDRLVQVAALEPMSAKDHGSFSAAPAGGGRLN